MNKVVVKNTKDCVKDAIKKQIISNKDELLKDLETMDKNTVVVKVFDSIRYYNLPTKTRNALELANIEITPEVLKEKGKEERVTAFSESMMTYAEDLLEQIKIDDETKKLYNKTINYSTMSISDSIRKFAEVGYILQQKDVVSFFEILFKSNSYNEEKSSAFQKSIYIYNTYQGGGKSTLMDSLKYGYENIGLKTEYTSLPGNDLHSTTIEAFGKNDICFIPDLSHDSIINKDKTKSILRHETVSYRPAYSSIERNVKAVALTMMVSNAEPRIINRCDRTLVPFEVIPVDTSSTSAIFNFFISIVLYVPIGFPRASTPFSLVILTLDIFILSFTSFSSVSIPSTSFSMLLACLYILFLSIAKSVLKFIKTLTLSVYYYFLRLLVFYTEKE